MTDDHMGQPDLVSRLVVGKLARELLGSYTKGGKTERAMGLVQFCDRLGVPIPEPAPVAKLVRQGEAIHGEK